MSAEAPARTALPERIGRYRIVRLLGRGGMAEVCLAQLDGPEGFSRDVALKYVLPEFGANAELVRMFLDEARLAAQLTHPNVIQIHDFGQADGRYFIAMEYLRGTSLRDLTKKLQATQQRVPDVALAAIGSQISGALAYAHSRRGSDGNPLGLVHRDVTPENIFLTEEGMAKLLDFGIAKAAGRLQEDTGFGSVKGKPAYMPLEQISGDGVDGRADVYALCASFWEIVAGEKPVLGKDLLEVLQKIISVPIPDLKQAVPTSDAQFAAVVMCGLERNRNLRPSAQELQSMFDGFLQARHSVNSHALLVSLLNGSLPPTRLERRSDGAMPMHTPPGPLATPTGFDPFADAGALSTDAAPPPPELVVPVKRATSELPSPSKSGAFLAPAIPPVSKSGSFPAPAIPPVRKTGEFPVPAIPSVRKTGEFAVPPNPSLRRTGEFPVPAIPPVRKTGEIPAAAIPSTRQTGQFPAPAIPPVATPEASITIRLDEGSGPTEPEPEPEMDEDAKLAAEVAAAVRNKQGKE